jgi:dihydropteroate synthase
MINSRYQINNVLKGPFAIMGIVNVTPDSFYDGGRHSSVSAAVEHALKLRDEGADILDIGGVSSRPGASAVSVKEELERILPVIKSVVNEFDGPVSVDTTWASVAEAALECGASWINDISAGRFDGRMKEVAASFECPVILMHSRGTPQIMQNNPVYDDVVGEVKNELLKSVDKFLKAGVVRKNIIIDPGFGFAKKKLHNIALLKGLKEIVRTGFTVLVGTSRKSLIGEITGKNADNRLYGTLATVASAYLRGARIFRVHDVDATKDMLKVLSVIENDTTISSE